ncbi:MAG: response regulator [candidate division Zixibacteria bacterium]|nr:response regulator [candidate division Zixibacteria bacterium]
MIDSTNSRKTGIVLVVDDEEVVTGLLKAILNKEGHQVYTGNSGREAVDMALKVKPNLIIMDIVMPDLDGYQAIDLIKQNTSLRDIPVIFLTGRSADEDGGRAFAKGAASFIRKPFTNDQIKDLVTLALQSVMT